MFKWFWTIFSLGAPVSRACEKGDTAAYGGRTRILGVSVVSRQHPAHVLLFRANHTKKN